MKETKNYPVEINNRHLLSQISLAQVRLYNKIINLDLKSLNISEYNQSYLGSKINSLKGVLKLYGRLIYLSLYKRNIAINNFVFVDYGGGSGVMSYLAAEMGIGTVIYNDIYDVSCLDVKHLSTILELKLDHIVCGDADKLILYLQENSLQINSITSYDVLEHIYDVESHFNKLGSFSKNSLRIIYASGANIENPLYVNFVRKKQIEFEYKVRDKNWGHKDRDSLEPFFEVRKNMISKYSPDLDLEIVEQLSRATRGLIKQDIEKCVDEFHLKGSISYHINHPTNTCDPYTGNWAEHLMDYKWLRQIIKNSGFSVEIMTGRFNSNGPLHKKIIKILLNAMIQLLGRHGMFFAPYYVVCANPIEKDT